MFISSWFSFLSFSISVSFLFSSSRSIFISSSFFRGFFFGIFISFVILLFLLCLVGLL